MTATLRIEGLTHGFGDRTVLDGVDLDVAAGEALAIVGPSGCGKSTLLRIIAGVVVPDAGTITVAGEPVAGRTGHAAYMPQTDALLPWRRALGNATLGAEIAGMHPSDARVRAQGLFTRFGLSGFERSWPGELSGGMRQRVAFLRTVLAGQPVLLLDEPFGALDAITRADLHTWLGTLLSQEPRTTLLVTHDVDDALRLADRIMVMSPRPGRPVLTIGLPRDRPRAALRLLDADLAAVKRRVLATLSGDLADDGPVVDGRENDRPGD